MAVKDIIEKIQSTSEFKEWRKDNDEAYITSAFAMFEGAPEEWLVTYFDAKSRHMTTFSSKKVKKHEEPFSKEDVIPELLLDEVSIDESQAVESADRTLKESYKNESIQKTILVLQKLNHKPVWNITFMTTGLKVVNVKVSASSGAVLDHKITAISDFMQSK